MRAFTVTALMAAIVALPFLLKQRKPETKPGLMPICGDPESDESGQIRRYDIYDFVD